MKYKLRLSIDDYETLYDHLLGNSGKEAVAIGLCGRCGFENEKIMTLQKIVIIPYDECDCYEDFISWKTTHMIPLLQEAAQYDYAILKIHSHPGGGRFFSEQDDRSDYDLFDSIIGGWCESEEPHLSAIMLPDGEIYGRVFLSGLESAKLDNVMVIGDDIQLFYHEKVDFIDEYSARTRQTFGEGTYAKLKRLKVGIVGCSGTGGVSIEQLMRYAIEEIVLVDPDIIEEKNLNRLIGSRNSDDCLGQAKVEFYKRLIMDTNLGSRVRTFQTNICTSIETLQCLSTCDIILGCMDSASGRNILNRLCTFCLIPYFDMGVSIVADGHGGIEKVTTAVHYIQPGKSSLFSRKAYNMEQVRAEILALTEPDVYETQKKEGYVQNAYVERPAVISINSCASSMAVIEMLSRIHPFKNEPLNKFAKIVYDISEGDIITFFEAEFPIDDRLLKHKGKGMKVPYLDLPTLS